MLVNFEVNRFAISKVESERLKELLENVDSAICVQGMPGIANVGRSVVESLIKFNNAKKILQIYFSDFPSHVSVDSTGRVNILKSEIYFYWDERAERHVFLLTGDAQPTSNMGVNILSKYIAKVLYGLNVKFLIALGAMPTGKSGKQRVFVTATAKSLLEEYEGLPEVEILREGVIIGMNGVVPCFASRLYRIDGVILLSETLSFLEEDDEASCALANLLQERLKLNVNLDYFKDENRSNKRVNGSEQLGYIS